MPCVTATPTSHPLKRGFDEFYGHLGGGHTYFPEKLTIRRSQDAKDESESYRTWLLKNYEPVQPRKYITDDFSDEAVAFIERNRDWPFFLFLSYNAPHTPLEATDKYLNRFPAIKDNKRKTYAAMVSAVDDGVGRVLKELKRYEKFIKSKLLDKLIFSKDITQLQKIIISKKLSIINVKQ